MSKNPLWYYLDQRDEKISFPEEDLPELVRLGRVRSRTLLWAPGTATEWKSCGELFPSIFLPGAVILGGETTPIPIASIRRLGASILPHNGAARTASVLLVVFGTLLSFTVIGLPSGALFIFAGFQLLQAARSLRTASEQGLESSFHTGQHSLGLFWKLLSLAAGVGAATLLAFLLLALLLLFDIVNLPATWIEFLQKSTPPLEPEAQSV